MCAVADLGGSGGFHGQVVIVATTYMQLSKLWNPPPSTNSTFLACSSAIASCSSPLEIYFSDPDCWGTLRQMDGSRGVRLRSKVGVVDRKSRCGFQKISPTQSTVLHLEFPLIHLWCANPPPFTKSQIHLWCASVGMLKGTPPSIL